MLVDLLNPYILSKSVYLRKSFQVSFIFCRFYRFENQSNRCLHGFSQHGESVLKFLKSLVLTAGLHYQPINLEKKYYSWTNCIAVVRALTTCNPFVANPTLAFVRSLVERCLSCIEKLYVLTSPDVTYLLDRDLTSRLPT